MDLLVFTAELRRVVNLAEEVLSLVSAERATRPCLRVDVHADR
jgi:hypothetical protein